MAAAAFQDGSAGRRVKAIQHLDELSRLSSMQSALLRQKAEFETSLGRYNDTVIQLLSMMNTSDRAALRSLSEEFIGAADAFLTYVTLTPAPSTQKQSRRHTNTLKDLWLELRKSLGQLSDLLRDG
ncbi:hypothetical protein [Streptomyces prunicolor]|jgi:hypothetical protein|uniref:hypothetical protein n=1 Tax=Streptomyces prunicolor TaxID=67348 RepID=UPI002256820C|nr:hypothetical protein [Streptomyces prunicolor]MCX5241134.1 hypothetical protein [Streptomyces prunicolor]